MAERATSTVVGKAMEATIVVIYVGVISAALYGGVVPAYQGTAGEEVAERTLADAASDVERAVPPESDRAETRLEVELPATIDGAGYRIRADGDRLVLDHPDSAISTETPLVLPERVVAVSGTWNSGGSTTVRVTTTDAGLEVTLE